MHSRASVTFIYNPHYGSHGFPHLHCVKKTLKVIQNQTKCLKKSFQSDLRQKLKKQISNNYKKAHAAVSNPCWFDKKKAVSAHTGWPTVWTPKSPYFSPSHRWVSALLEAWVTGPKSAPSQNRCSSPVPMSWKQDSSHEQMLLRTHCLFMQNSVLNAKLTSKLHPPAPTNTLASISSILSQYFKVAASSSACGVLPQPPDSFRMFSVEQERAP